MQIEEKYMARCIELARHGSGRTAPNPMVGAVIVHNNAIIGEGYHRCCGEAHAEVNAIASVKDESLLRDSTLYVNLEPCSHYGKTPPCAELIIRKRIPRVIVGCLDPFPEVSGRGVDMLRKAGIDVESGILEKEAMAVNEAFMTFQLKERPFVTLKWAESADGFIDRQRADNSTPPTLFSTAVTAAKVHKLRAESAAILVGTHTALLDNPSLSVRLWGGKSPVRSVIDKDSKLPKDSHLFDGTIETLVFTAQRQLTENNTEYITLDFKSSVIHQILECLYKRKLNSLLVEGGASLLQQFIDAGLWDRAIVEKSPINLSNGIKAPIIHSCSTSYETFGKHTFAIHRHISSN